MPRTACRPPPRNLYQLGPCDLLPSRPWLRAVAGRAARGHCSADLAADDIAQAIRLAVVEKSAAYDPRRGTPGAFCEVVARTTATRLRQRARRRRARRGEMPDVESGSAAGAPADAGCRDPHHDAAMRRAVRALVATLDEPLRRICQMLVEGTDRRQIARELGIARSTLYRRLAELREAFQRAGLDLSALDA